MIKVKFDYSELIGKIKAKHLTFADVARELGISENALTAKLQCRTYFKENETWTLRKLLEIPQNEHDFYFFTIVV